jgi:hypothetical protein
MDDRPATNGSATDGLELGLILSDASPPWFNQLEPLYRNRNLQEVVVTMLVSWNVRPIIDICKIHS